MNTEIIVNFNSDPKALDLFEDVDLLLNYNEEDIKEFGSVGSEYSKTITIPATPNNNEILGYFFDLTEEGNFNVLKSTPIKVTQSTIEVFVGELKLLSVSRYENGSKEYEVVLLSQKKSFFDLAGTIKLNELDYSEFNHTLTKTNIQNSWATSIRFNNANRPFEAGLGYVYPLENRGNQNAFIWLVRDFVPSVYLKTIIDKAFSKIGYAYNSSFIRSELFSRLIMPSVFNRIPLTGEEIARAEFIAQPPTGFASGGLLIETLTANPIFVGTNSSAILINSSTDNPNVYDLTSGYFTPDRTANYNVSSSQSVQFQVALGVGQPSYTNWKVSSNTAGTVAAEITYQISLETSLGGVLQSQNQTIQIPLTLNTLSSFQFTENINAAFNQTLSAGQTYRIRVNIIATTLIFFRLDGTTTTTGEITATPTDTLTLKIAQPYIEEGESFDIGRVLPDMTFKDLLIDLQRMFNLRVIVDKENNKVLIETADDYFNAGEVKDWTHKLDYASEINVQSISELGYKAVELTYKSDSDYPNKFIEERFNYVYGRYLNDFENDFSIDTKKIETQLTAATAIGGAISSTDRNVVPCFYTYQGSAYAPISKIAPRILYYSGLKNYGSGFTFKSANEIPINNFSPSVWYTSYPMAGTFDDAYNPSFDLNFGVAQTYFFNYTNLTDANLYNVYWKRTVEEMISPNTKVLKASFYLTAEDIYNFKPNDKIFIDNTYYRISKIIDYNPVKDGLTIVELVRVNEVSIYTRRTLTRAGEVSLTPINVGSLGTPRAGVVQAGTNDVSDYATEVMIVGSGNVVSAGASGVMIQGNNNYIAPNVNNVTIIGSGYIVNESNVYVNDFESGFNVADGGEDEVQNPFSSTTLNLLDGMQDSVQQVNYDFNINLIQ